MLPKPLKYVALGLMFILPGEFLNQVLVHGSIRNLASTSVIYIVLLAFGYLALLFSSNSIKPKGLELTVYALAAGFLGLMGEWFLFGNAPWINPQAVQVSMFVWWMSVFMVPRLFLESKKQYGIIKMVVFAYYGVASVFYLAVAFKSPAEGAAVFAYAIAPFLLLELWYVARKWKEGG